MMHVGGGRCVAAAVSVCAIFALAACGSQSEAIALPSEPGATPTTSSSTFPSSPGSASEAAARALAAYHDAFADWSAVEAVPGKEDYHNPRLANHLTGAALSYVTSAVYINTNVDNAVAHGKPILLDPAVGEMVPATHPTQVVINDCVQTDNWLLYTTDGHLYNNVPGGRNKTQALVAFSGGTWKVSQLIMQINGTC